MEFVNTFGVKGHLCLFLSVACTQL